MSNIHTYVKKKNYIKHLKKSNPFNLFFYASVLVQCVDGPEFSTGVPVNKPTFIALSGAGGKKSVLTDLAAKIVLLHLDSLPLLCAEGRAHCDLLFLWLLYLLAGFIAFTKYNQCSDFVCE